MLTPQPDARLPPCVPSSPSTSSTSLSLFPLPCLPSTSVDSAVLSLDLQQPTTLCPPGMSGNDQDVDEAQRAPPLLLSSLHRPARPPCSTAPTSMLVDLPQHLLHHLLAFVPSYAFYLRLPYLNHHLRWLWTDEAVHRAETARRFHLTPVQWRQFSAHAWSQLQPPVQCFADDERYSSSADDWVSADGYNWPDEPPPYLSPSLVKDWALECHHLYQHVHLAERVLTRDLPRVSSDGLRLTYNLPRAVVQLLVDRLTMRWVVDWVRSGDERWPPDEHRHQLLRMSYDTRFRPPHASALQPCTLRLCGRAAHCYPVTHEVTAQHCLSSPFQPLTSSTPIEADAIAAAPMWADTNDALAEWLDSQLLEEEWVALAMPELLQLGWFDDFGHPAVHALWVGPVLRAALSEWRARQRGHQRGDATVDECHISLEQCCVVQVPTRLGLDYSSEEAFLRRFVLPRLLAPTTRQWMEEGGLYDWNVAEEAVEGRSWEGAVRVREWLAVDGQAWGGDEEAVRDRRSGTRSWRRPERSNEEMAPLQDEWERMVRRAAAALRCPECQQPLASHQPPPCPNCGYGTASEGA